MRAESETGFAEEAPQGVTRVYISGSSKGQSGRSSLGLTRYMEIKKFVLTELKQMNGEGTRVGQERRGGDSLPICRVTGIHFVKRFPGARGMDRNTEEEKIGKEQGTSRSRKMENRTPKDELGKNDPTKEGGIPFVKKG